MKIQALELPLWVLLYFNMWNSHRFQLAYCLNSLGSDPPRTWVDQGLSRSLYSAQVFPRDVEDDRMEHCTMFSNSIDSVNDIFSIIGLLLLFNGQLFQSSQKPNPFEKAMLQPWTTFSIWETFSFYNISASSTRLVQWVAATEEQTWKTQSVTEKNCTLLQKMKRTLENYSQISKYTSILMRHCYSSDLFGSAETCRGNSGFILITCLFTA